MLSVSKDMRLARLKRSVTGRGCDIVGEREGQGGQVVCGLTYAVKGWACNVRKQAGVTAKGAVNWLVLAIQRPGDSAFYLMVKSSFGAS